MGSLLDMFWKEEKNQATDKELDKAFDVADSGINGLFTGLIMNNNKRDRKISKSKAELESAHQIEERDLGINKNIEIER